MGVKPFCDRLGTSSSNNWEDSARLWVKRSALQQANLDFYSLLCESILIKHVLMAAKPLLTKFGIHHS